MAKFNPPEGFLNIPGLPDIGGLVDQVTNLLPPVVADAIKGTVGKILDPADDSVKVGDPQPPGPPPIPVAAESKELNAAVKAIDAALLGIGLVLKLGFLIPDQYEAPLKALQGALKTVRGWLD